MASFLRACLALSEHPNAVMQQCSSLYSTAPVGPTLPNGEPQPRYLNAVCKISWAGDPMQLLALTQQIERCQGRKGGDDQRWMPRPLDLDILELGDLQVSVRSDKGQTLNLPHPYRLSRLFVLVPWAEISPLHQPLQCSQTLVELTQAAMQSLTLRQREEAVRALNWQEAKPWEEFRADLTDLATEPMVKMSKYDTGR